MPSSADNVILTFPPRPVSQRERGQLAEWFAASRREGLDVANAFVSERRGDDPKIAGRIVVLLQSSQEPAFVVYAPMEAPFWVVAAAPEWTELQRFHTLRQALNSIRPVLDGPDARHGTEATSSFA